MIPLGGMDSVQRLETMREYGATALLCTPSYALHLARVAAEHGLARRARRRSSASSARASRARRCRPCASGSRAAWGARCFDHAGASEVGSLAYPCAEPTAACTCSRTSSSARCSTPRPASRCAEGATGELVMTALEPHRLPGDPLPHRRHGRAHATRRARRATPACGCRRGSSGRVDDMVVIRGMNVFPSAIEEILRALGRRRRVLDHLLQRPARDGRGQGRGRARRTRARRARSRRGCARRSGCASGSCRSSRGSCRPTAARPAACRTCGRGPARPAGR